MLSVSRFARQTSRSLLQTRTKQSFRLRPQNDNACLAVRLVSSSSSPSPPPPPPPPPTNFQPLNYEPTPPEKLTLEMAEGIADITQFYLRHGAARRRLLALAADGDLDVVKRWQHMMEILLTTQVQVVTGLGYAASEEGLARYAQDLARCIQEADDTARELFSEVRRDTWRDMVATCFNIDVADIPTLSIVDARNIMHKVSSKMIEPDTLLEIQTKTAKIEDDDPDMAIAKKHAVLQEVIVHRVYLGGSPSLVEEAGLGSDAAAYAKLQCAMSDHEGDPLISQYASSAMVRIWAAAGIDLAAHQQQQGGG